MGRIESNPIRLVKKFKEPPAKDQILSGAEAQRLIENASQSIRPVLIVALHTGMRRGKILGLRWENVDVGRGYICIENSKSGRSRKVPMNAAVNEALRALPRESEFFFYNPETRGHVQGVKTTFKKACQRAEIEEIRFHDLRHNAASKMVEAGVDLVTVSKILGHASIQMTMCYAHPTPENMRRAVERLAEVLDPTRQKVDTVTVPKPATDSIRYN